MNSLTSISIIKSFVRVVRGFNCSQICNCCWEALPEDNKEDVQHYQHPIISTVEQQLKVCIENFIYMKKITWLAMVFKFD